MGFVAPSIFDGMLMWGLIYIVPVLLCICFFIYGIVEENKAVKIASIILVCFMVCFSSYLWYETMELPSVQEKTITVQAWQPNTNVETNEFGQLTITNADQLVLVSTDGETFQNTENFFFMKFETRDLLNNLKVGGTYKIKYYGWRNGFTSTFPNILEIEEVVDESNATSTNNYFGTVIS